MREIRFRAWDKEAKIMYPNVQNHIGNFDTAFGNMLRNKQYIFMQYIGLKDKNGKEIYEGDIVQADFWKFEVIWQKYGWGLKGIKRGWWRKFTEFESIEVIGNIHENPELLEK